MNDLTYDSTINYKHHLGLPTMLGSKSTSTKKQRKAKKAKRLNKQKGRNS